MYDKSEKELPIGFSMTLAMNKTALNNYGKLSYNEQDKIMKFIKNNVTGEEAKEKIDIVIKGLENNDIKKIIKT